MPLPTVLMTDCIRSSNKGQSHGGAYLVDLEKGTWRKVLDWNNEDFDWEGRGSNRGLRGIAFHKDEIYIVASDELFVFDQDFKIKRSFKSPYLLHAHEVFLDGDTLYITSTKFDSILCFDIPSQAYTKAWLCRLAYTRDPKTNADPGPMYPVVFAYDPRVEGGPEKRDTWHLNQVWVQDGKVFLSGVHMPILIYLDSAAPGGVRRFGSIPTWTHNARPYRDGILANSTGKDAVCYFDMMGEVLKEFPVPRYDESTLLNKSLTKDVARQAFGRGLVTTPDGLIIASSSPSTVNVYDFEAGTRIKSVNISMDVRNAPHGLAIWPY